MVDPRIFLYLNATNMTMSCVKATLILSPNYLTDIHRVIESNCRFIRPRENPSFVRVQCICELAVVFYFEGAEQIAINLEQKSGKHELRIRV